MIHSLKMNMIGTSDHTAGYSVFVATASGWIFQPRHCGLELLHPMFDPVVVVVMRSLLPEQRTLSLASSEELAARNKDDLPLFIQLDEWFHPDLAAGELPNA